MKNLALAVTFSGLLLFAGVALGAEKEQAAGSECLCGSQVQKAEKSGTLFKPLFPEYEIEPGIGG